MVHTQQCPGQESRSRALVSGFGKETGPKGGTQPWGTGVRSAERTKHRKKGQAASTNPKSSCYAKGQLPAQLSLPCRHQERLSSPFDTSAQQGQAAPGRLPLLSPQPGATTDPVQDSSALCHPFPPDLQLQLQDLWSSCSLQEGTRLLVGVMSSHTPFPPWGSSESSQDFQKNPLMQVSSPPTKLALFFHCPR